MGRSSAGHHAEELALVRRGLGERSGSQAADRFAANSAGRDDSGGAQLAQVPADEWLAQPDVVDQLGHGRRRIRESLDDPQPVHVGKCLVEEADLAELVRLIDDRGDRRADSSG
jgi:hypothetical protein